MIKRGFYIFCGILVLFSSCKTLQDMEQASDDVSSYSSKELLKAIESKHTDYSTVEIKRFTAEYSSAEEQKSFKGFLRYSANEKIMASIAPAMGIEMFRVLADKDTLGFIDRYNKQFYNGNYNFIKRRVGMNLNFHLLNFIVSGDVRQLPKAFQPGKDFIFSSNDKYLILSKTQEIDGIKFMIEYSYDSDFMLRRLYLKDFSNSNYIELIYREFFIEGKYMFPKVLSISGNSGRKILSLNLNYKSIEFNKTLNFPFSVSSKYSEISY